MRKRKIATTDMRTLCTALQAKGRFLFKIPNHTVYYSPLYHWPLGIHVGNYILFSAESIGLEEVFLGKVEGTETLRTGDGPTKLNYLEVKCVSRPQGRGKHGMVNQLSKVKIFEKSVVCLLQAARPINGN